MPAFFLTDVWPLVMPERGVNEFLDTALNRFPQVRRLVVGFSGGLDSTVLLHLLKQLQPLHGRELLAVHVHHGLSPNADAWADHAEALCTAWQIPFRLQRVQVRHTASLEAAARMARRTALHKLLQNDDALLLAHHRMDQAETVLFRLMRGSGVTGLAGMQAEAVIAVQDQASRPLWRPLLKVSRPHLECYAHVHGLTWIDDESNRDTAFDRNFLRHDILPSLQTHWPAAVDMLAATACRMQEADQLLQELAAELATSCLDDERRLLLPAVRTLSAARQRLVLRYWLKQCGFQLPDEAVLNQIAAIIRLTRADAEPLVTWPSGEVRRYRQHLYALSPLAGVSPAWCAEWDMTTPLVLPDGRCLQAKGSSLSIAPVTVRFRQGGERLQGHGLSHDLKKLLQSAAVPPWERQRLPLVFAGAELLAVAGTTLRAPAWPADLRLIIHRQ
jgi:tRNA(Ile)-lysidine synthase